jgi:hypothetical protein
MVKKDFPWAKENELAGNGSPMNREINFTKNVLAFFCIITGYNERYSSLIFCKYTLLKNKKISYRELRLLRKVNWQVNRNKNFSLGELYIFDLIKYDKKIKDYEKSNQKKFTGYSYLLIGFELLPIGGSI